MKIQKKILRYFLFEILILEIQYTKIVEDYVNNLKQNKKSQK